MFRWMYRIWFNIEHWIFIQIIKDIKSPVTYPVLVKVELGKDRLFNKWMRTGKSLKDIITRELRLGEAAQLRRLKNPPTEEACNRFHEWKDMRENKELIKRVRERLKH